MDFALQATLVVQRRAVAASLAMIFCLAGAMAAPASAQKRGAMLPRVSPNAAVAQTVGASEVRLTYGRPHVRGRQIFGQLVPYDEVWRTGANEATTITFSDDVTVEGQPLAAGTYGLFTVPGTEQWAIVFNQEPDQWGAFNYDEAQDALRVDVTPQEAAQHKMMTFTFESVTDSSAVLALYWDRTRVPVSLAFDTPALIRAHAAAAMETADGWQMPYQYAAYALDQGVFLDDATDWVNRSIALKKTFENTALKARLLAAQDRYDEAVTAGEQALALASNMDEAPRGADQLEALVAEWKAAQ